MSELRLTNQQSRILGGLLIAFFIIPYLPQQIILLTDTFLVRLALLAGLIAAAYVSPVVAIAAFIVLGMVFMERNKAKMHQLQSAMNLTTSMESPAIADIVTPETAPEQPAFERPIVDNMQFMPQDDSGDDGFMPVAPSMNQKKPLPTEGSNDGSQKAIQQLFEWVNPNLAQAP
jgi:hypothetical protein